MAALVPTRRARSARPPRTMPRRPGWLAPTDIAYRSVIFKHLAGILTYGSPLEKFAGLWPALVPISTRLSGSPASSATTERAGSNTRQRST